MNVFWKAVFVVFGAFVLASCDPWLEERFAVVRFWAVPFNAQAQYQNRENAFLNHVTNVTCANGSVLQSGPVIASNVEAYEFVEGTTSTNRNIVFVVRMSGGEIRQRFSACPAGTAWIRYHLYGSLSGSLEITIGNEETGFPVAINYADSMVRILNISTVPSTLVDGIPTNVVEWPASASVSETLTRFDTSVDGRQASYGLAR